MKKEVARGCGCAIVSTYKGGNDMTHLHALELRASNEREYLRIAKTDQEKELRQVWLDQINKEINIEKAVFSDHDDLPEMSDDELLEALFEE